MSSLILIDITLDEIIRIAIFTGILMAVWLVMRTVMRVTRQVFRFGCFAILFLGLGLVLLSWLGGA